MSAKHSTANRRKKSLQLSEKTSVCTPAVRPGTHQPTHELLIGRREDVLRLLEIYWAELGWDFLQLRSRDDVVRLFTAAEKLFRSSVFDLFRVPGRDSSENLAALRKKGTEISWKLHETRNQLQELDHLHERIAAELRNPSLRTQSPDQILELKIALSKFEREIDDAKFDRERLQAAYSQLQEETVAAEAAFSQDELVRLIVERRYSPNPVTIADAIAGLPFIGYRQSIERCRSIAPGTCAHLRYEIFKAVDYLYKSARSEKLRTQLPERVRNLPPRFSSARQELRRNFYFLRRAVEQVCYEKPLPMQAPFRIVSQYNALLSSMSIVEELRSRDQQLR